MKHSAFSLAVLAVLILLLSTAASAAVVYVKWDSPGPTFDGTSWDTAFHTVQAGLDAAAPDDEVWVARGTYVECITLKDGVQLYGGYAGTGEMRDIGVYITVLDGNGVASVVTSLPGVTITAGIDGFTIQHGTGTLVDDVDPYGGGILCRASSPQISNNRLISNSAYYGAGIYCESGSPAILNNHILSNSTSDNSGWGGGIHCRGSSPTVRGNKIEVNQAGFGGGICCSYGSSPTITDNTICGNIGGYVVGSGGGIYCSDSAPTIAGNRISGNITWEGNGGGIYCNGSYTAIITGNTITRNTAYYGGGLDVSSPASIVGNTISENIAVEDAGGIRCQYYSPSIVGNQIINNTTGRQARGGGVFCSSSSPTITGNTIIGNGAYDGGAVYCWGSSPTLSNNILAFNVSGVCNAGGGLPALRNNCVYGNTEYGYSGVSAGSGDISSDPLIASLAYGNMHIQCSSPCIDTGWNEAPGLSSADIDSQARVQGVRVDIGADESDGTNWASSPNITVRVSQSGNDANDGSTWLLAKKTVWAGIDAAAALGGDVWVQAGTYGGGIVIRPFVSVYGGFAGTENSKSDRDWSANETILQGGGSVVTLKGGYQANTIDGFTIRNGTGTGINWEGKTAGGGIYCHYSSPVIRNNLLVQNSASCAGGGVYCYYSSSLISNNTIAGNTGGKGGGIFCDYGSAIMVNNTVVGNRATACQYPDGDGGGIYSSGSMSTIANNLVAHNIAMIDTMHNFIGTGGIAGGGVLRNNCAYGNTPINGEAGVDGILVDPLLADRTGGDYHLTLLSPCIDAGWNDAPGLSVADMDAEERINRSIVDIGADEYWLRRPKFTPSAGTYAGPLSVAITSDTSGATIHYTQNGFEPTDRDAIYTGPIPVNESLTLKARAWKDGWLPSSVATAVYTLPAKTPTFSPDGGTYSPSCRVSIGCETLGADIWYTTNGEEPTPENGTLYAAPVLVSADLTLKARAYKEGSTPSAVQAAEYAIVRSVRDLKRRPDGFSVTIAGSMVSAAFPGFFYIEADDRSSGSRVESIGHALAVGMRADVVGTMRTNSDGERYVEAASAVQSAPPANTGSVVPILLCNRDLAGGDWLYDPVYGSGQIGVADNIGLNNIGLLVTTAGRVRYVSTGDFFVISDGFTHFDPSGVWGIRVAAAGLTKPARGKYVTVTGISSMFASRAERYPIILVRDQADIVIRQ